MRRLLTISIVMLAVCNQATAQEPADLLAIADAVDNALNAHDLDQWLSYFTDDGVFDFAPLPTPLNGKEEMRAFFAATFEGFPDFGTTEGRVLAAGNTVVVEHSTSGTHQGVWNGIPPTGNTSPMPHIDIYEFEADKVKQLTTYADMAGVMIQLGAMPVPKMPELVPSIPLPDAEPTGLTPMEANAEAIARWNSHDIVQYTKMLHPDFQGFAGPVGMSLDRDAWIAMTEVYFLGFSNAHIDIIRQLDLGDGWILTEEISQGTHDGPFSGVPASGKEAQVRAVLLNHYDADGLLTSQNYYFDNMALMAQIMPKSPDWPSAPDYLVQDEIHSPSLEGNLLGDPATRPVLVYLPPSYETSPEKRYPTVYLLHGYDTNHNCYTSSGVNLAIKSLTGIDLGADVGSIVADLSAAGQMDELIIVLPNAVNSLGGSMYERSPLIGDYRDYIAKDLVTYIDGKYRTIAHSSSRGIAGHSMGGYGALSLAIEYPEVFGAVASLSPALCDMEVDPALDDYMAKYPLVLGLPIPGSTPEDMWNIFLGYWEANLLYAMAAAWTPNLENPPFYVDLPVQYPGPSIVTDVLEQWKERDLVSQVERDGANLSGKPIFVDEGRGPAMIMAEVTGVDRLLAALHAQGLSYTYDAFDGDHLTYFGYQIACGLEFLSDALSSEQ
ncbi:MAG: ester cyclase [Planctomycetes bacterium]|nr:ester cyclase [Planctomycetota bacterium]MBL7187617.1 ester cyclase [Phycisphaerae bacterium]